MQVTLVLAIGLLQLGIFSATCTASATGFKVLGVVWGNSTHPIAAGPGESDVPLTVTMQNYGTTCNLVNLEGKLEVSNIYSNFNGSSTYPLYYLQQLAPSTIFNMVFYLNIAANASVGNNSTSSYYLYLYYNYTNYTVNTARNEQTFSIGIPMRGSPSLTFMPNSRALVAGEVNNLTLKVHNGGTGYAYGIDTVMASSSSIYLENTPQVINSLAPGATGNVTLQLYVPPSMAGQSISADLDPHYISPYGYNTSATSYLSLYALSALQSSVSLSASTSEVQSGSINKVNLTITNNGASVIDNVSAILSAQSPLTLIGSEGYANFKSIAPGASVNIPTELYVASSSSSGSTVANLDVQLAYDGQSESNQRVLSFLTPGYINLTRVSTTILPSTLTRGGIFSLTSTLNNLGTTTASAVTVTAYPPKRMAPLGANTTFVGDILPDNPTAFTVSFRISPNAKSGTYVIPVVLTYLNNLHQKVNATMNFSVEVGSGNASLGSSPTAGSATNSSIGKHGISASGMIIPLVIVVIAGGIGIYLYRKSNRKVRNK